MSSSGAVAGLQTRADRPAERVKFGAHEATPYAYMKALYEYFRDDLGEDAGGHADSGRTGRVPGGCGSQGRQIPLGTMG